MPQIKKSIPYHQQVYELLKEEILTGKLHCGERISEVGLSQMLKISRSPVREAIRMLEQDGLVVSDAGDHLINPMEPQTIHDIYEFRIGVESYAARLATRHFQQKDYDFLMFCIQKCKEANAAHIPLDQVYHSTKYHDYIVSLSGNSFMIEQLGKIRNLVALSRIKELNHDLSYAELDHVQIANEMLAGHEDEVERLMRNHLTNNIRSILS